MIKLIHKNWKIENIDGVFFDKDGTLIDSHIYWGEIVKRRAREIVQYFRLKPYIFDYLCKEMGFSLQRNMLLSRGPTGLYSRERVIEKVLSVFNKKLKINTNFNEIDTLFKKVHNEFLKDAPLYIKVIEDCYDFILKLKDKGTKLALITSDSINNTNVILKHINLENIFDIVIGKESCDKPKESGEPAIIVLNTLNLNPANTVCIGDAPADKKMGDNAGIFKTILVATGQIKYKNLRVITKYTVNSLKEIEIF